MVEDSILKSTLVLNTERAYLDHFPESAIVIETTLVVVIGNYQIMDPKFLLMCKSSVKKFDSYPKKSWQAVM